MPKYEHNRDRQRKEPDPRQDWATVLAVGAGPKWLGVNEPRQAKGWVPPMPPAVTHTAIHPAPAAAFRAGDTPTPSSSSLLGSDRHPLSAGPPEGNLVSRN